MKLTPQQRDQYFLSFGIHASDLLSAEPLHLTELPEGVVLSDAQKSIVLQFVRLWNGTEDPRQKIDMAHAMERCALRASKGLARDQVAEAWAAYLLLGRVRGCEARRDAMQALAHGEALPRRARTRKPKPEVAAPVDYPGVHIRSRALAELPYTPAPLED